MKRYTQICLLLSVSVLFLAACQLIGDPTPPPIVADSTEVPLATGLPTPTAVVSADGSTAEPGQGETAATEEAYPGPDDGTVDVLVTTTVVASPSASPSASPTGTALPTATPTPVAVIPGTTVQHRVSEGEWLVQIARCYGASYAAVRQANRNIVHPDLILPGWTITVPNVGSVGRVVGPPCVVTYVVQAGDTFSSLAQRYGTTAAILQRANPGLLVVGRIIYVPNLGSGGPLPATVAATAPVVTLPAATATTTIVPTTIVATATATATVTATPTATASATPTATTEAYPPAGATVTATATPTVTP